MDFYYPEMHIADTPSLLNPIWDTSRPTGENEYDLWLSLDRIYGSDKILHNRRVELNGVNYWPDLLIQIGNISLDIEIDEPYSLAQLKPTHIINSDNHRNTIFVTTGCSVLRFSEYQEKYKTQQCCQIVKSLINALRAGIYDIKQIPIDISFRDRRWTYDIALQYIEEEKRSYYNYTDKDITCQPEKIIKSFNTLNELCEHIWNSNIFHSYSEDCVLFIPSKITNIKIHNQTKERSLFVELYPSLIRRADTMKLYSYFSSPPVYQVKELTNPVLYSQILIQKESQYLIEIKEHFKFRYFENNVFNYYLMGSKDDFYENRLTGGFIYDDQK